MPCLLFDNHIPLSSIVRLQYVKGLIIYPFPKTSSDWGKDTTSVSKAQYTLLCYNLHTFGTDSQGYSL